MSKEYCRVNPYLEDKGKNSSNENTSEELYKYLNQDKLLCPELKAPEMKHLLLLLRKGYLNVRWLNEFAKTKCNTLKGPAGKVLVHNTNYVFGLICVGARELRGDSFLIIKRGNTIIFYTAEGKKFNIDPEEWVYATVLEEKLLPIDLREWPHHWIRIPLNISLIKIERLLGYRKTKTTLVKEIHKVRQINFSPGKKQRKQIEQQCKKSRREIDESFSLDE